MGAPGVSTHCSFYVRAVYIMNYPLDWTDQRPGYENNGVVREARPRWVAVRCPAPLSVRPGRS